MWLTRTFARQLVTYPPATDFETAISIVPDVARQLPTQANGDIAPMVTYTFHLQDDIRWNSSPPRAVTAHDFVRAFKYFCNPVSPVGAPGYYTRTIVGMTQYCAEFMQVPANTSDIRRFMATHEIEGVQAVDASTLVFTLRAPATDFLNLLAMPFASAVPEEYLTICQTAVPPEYASKALCHHPLVQNRQIELARIRPGTAHRSAPSRVRRPDQHPARHR
jgi:peptide/nickel transport system substrate-binding protein